MTIKTIYDLFNFVSIDNININSFDYGKELKQNAANSKFYPQIFLEEPFRILNPNEIFIFNVLFLDRALNNDNSSIVESISKMHLITNQSFEILKSALLSLHPNASITEGEKITLQQVFSDVLCGIRVDYTIKAAKDLKMCENGSLGLNFKDYVNNLPTIGDLNCDVVFDTINLSQTLTTLDIETIFTSIIGIDKFRIYLFDPLFATWDLIHENLTPSLINNYPLPLLIPGDYLVRIIYYDLCELGITSPEYPITII